MEQRRRLILISGTLAAVILFSQGSGWALLLGGLCLAIVRATRQARFLDIAVACLFAVGFTLHTVAVTVGYVIGWSVCEWWNLRPDRMERTIR